MSKKAEGFSLRFVLINTGNISRKVLSKVLRSFDKNFERLQENEKNYPDIKSLVLMSEVFQVALDNLVKGDLERMKKEIDTQEYAKFQKDSTIFTVLFIALLIVPIPLVMLWKWFGMALYLCLFGIGMYFAVRIEKYKKKYDIQTFKEIVAFTDGKSLDEIEKAREEGKRPYQKALLVAGSAALAVIIALIMTAVMRLFS